MSESQQASVHFLRKRIGCLIAALVIAASYWMVTQTIYYWKRMQTADTMAAITCLPIFETADSKPFTQGSLARMVHERLPELPYWDERLRDAWGYPIAIIVTPKKDAFDLSIRSPGPDGVFDTRDDVSMAWSVVPD